MAWRRSQRAADMRVTDIVRSHSGFCVGDRRFSTPPRCRNPADVPAAGRLPQRENRQAVHDAWRLSYHDIRRSLAAGFYQGWDLHPAQLPMRYAAVYCLFLEGLADASTRLRRFIDQAARATRVGNIFVDAATGQGLLNFFLRALNCGAITEEQVAPTGLDANELRRRSFMSIVRERVAKTQA